MSSTSSIEDEALYTIILTRASQIEKQGVKEAGRRAELPQQLAKLLTALNRAPCKDLRQTYGSDTIYGIGEFQVESLPGADPAVWQVLYRIYYPGARPDGWRRGVTNEELDRLIPPILRLECNSNLPDGVHCTGTALTKTRVEPTAEGALDVALTVLHSIGIQIVGKEHTPP